MSEMNKYQFFITIVAKYKQYPFVTDLGTIERCVESPILERPNRISEGNYVTFDDPNTLVTLTSKVESIYANITEGVDEIHCRDTDLDQGNKKITDAEARLNDHIKLYHRAFKQVLKGMHGGTGTGK